MNFPSRREARRQDAEDRQSIRDKRTDEEQMLRCGAKEQARLSKRVERRAKRKRKSKG